LLSIEKIVVYYGSAQALSEVSMEIESGCITTVIGVNGAGKSTILKSICGLVPLTSGRITFMGTQINGLKAHNIVEMGISMVPEGKRLFPYMTVYENLVMGAFLRRDNDGIQRDIEMVYDYFPRLKERQTQKACSLSGGEQQMLAIGRGLLSNPKLMLLDEPSMGLSPIMTKKVGEIIQRIVGVSGVSVLLVEQNANLALQLAKNAYVVENGRVVMEGSVEMIRKHNYVKEAYLGL